MRFDLRNIMLSTTGLLVSVANGVYADPGVADYSNPDDDNCTGPICKKVGIIAGSILGSVGLLLILYCACKKEKQNQADIPTSISSGNQQALLAPTRAANEATPNDDAQSQSSMKRI